jgi:hypothetical protein
MGVIDDNAMIQEQLDHRKRNLRQAVALAKAQKKVAFPVEVFPVFCQEMIQAYAKIFGCATEHYGLSMLTVAGAAAGNSLRVVERGNAHPAIMYSVIVDKPSTGKSPILETCISPLWALEKKYAEEHRQAYEEHTSAARRGEAVGDPPPRKEIVLGDFTVESVYRVLNSNHRGVIIFRDELSGFLRGMGRYAKSGGNSEEAFWLEAWTGQGYKINRRNEGALFLGSIFCSILGTTQPGVIQEFAGGSKALNGFLARFLFSFPDDSQKLEHKNDKPAPIFREKWAWMVQLIASIQPDDLNQPHLVQLSVKAQQLYAEFYNRNAEEINQCDDEVTEAILGKFDTYCLRIALALEIMSWAEEWMKMGLAEVPNDERDYITVGTTSMQGAIKLCRYFRATALKVVNRLSGPAEALPLLQREWYKSLPDEFTRIEAVEIGKEIKLSEATIGRLLPRNDLFKRHRQGVYSRIY